MAYHAIFTPTAGSARNIMIFDFSGNFENEFKYRGTENTGLAGNYRIYLGQVGVEEKIRIVVASAVESTILTARNLKGSLVTGNGTFTNVRLLNARRVRGLNQSSVSVSGNVITPVFDYYEMTSIWVKEAT